MPYQERYEGSKADHHEEWQAGYPGNMPSVWNKDVQNREELSVIILAIGDILKIEAGYLKKEPSLSFIKLYLISDCVTIQAAQYLWLQSILSSSVRIKKFTLVAYTKLS